VAAMSESTDKNASKLLAVVCHPCINNYSKKNLKLDWECYWQHGDQVFCAPDHSYQYGAIHSGLFFPDFYPSRGQEINERLVKFWIGKATQEKGCGWINQKAVGLKAENKRSAVSAALKRTALELMQRMQRRDRSHAMAELWFMKREGCRKALSMAMKGKRNRAAKESGHSSILTHSANLAHFMHDGGTENGGMEELKMGLKAEGRAA